MHRNSETLILAQRKRITELNQSVTDLSNKISELRLDKTEADSKIKDLEEKIALLSVAPVEADEIKPGTLLTPEEPKPEADRGTDRADPISSDEDTDEVEESGTPKPTGGRKTRTKGSSVKKLSEEGPGLASKSK